MSYSTEDNSASIKFVSARNSAQNGQTLGAHMDESKGYTSGFDYLRLGLSVAVLLWHSYSICYGFAKADLIASRWAGYITFWILPMFFALSGFLITSSLARTPSIKKFIWLRLIRIYPALAVEVILSALILGVLATSLPLREYFSSPIFFNYLLNIFGWVHYELPGVFDGHPVPIVNGSLWTVPYELECYIVLTVLSLIALRRRPELFFSLFIAATVLRTASTFIWPYTLPSPANVGGRHLVLFFLAGVFINLLRRKIPFNGAVAIACALTGAICLYYNPLILIAPLPVAYVTVWLGLQRPTKIPVLMGGDYSYGIYLYAGPIQQAVWHWSTSGKSYLGNTIASLIIVSLFAAFSWHFIEKTMLNLKKMF